MAGRLALRRVEAYVPQGSVSVADLAAPVGLTAGEVQLLTRFLGLDRVATAGDLPVRDMLLRVGESALAEVDRSRVRHLVHTHTMQLLAPPAVRLVDSLRDGLDLDRARAFAMSQQNCVTALYALKVVEALLQAEPPDALALILIGEKVPSPAVQHIPGTTLLGDAAAACLVGLGGPGDTVLASAYRTLGEFHGSLDMSAALHERYRQVYVPTMASVMRDAVHGAGLALDDIALVLPHNVNRYSWSLIAKHLGMPLDRVYLDNVPRTSHCYCADPFVNLATARAEKALNAGDTVLMVAAGVGATFGAVVVRTAGQGR